MIVPVVFVVVAASFCLRALFRPEQHTRFPGFVRPQQLLNRMVDVCFLFGWVNANAYARAFLDQYYTNKYFIVITTAAARLLTCAPFFGRSENSCTHREMIVRTCTLRYAAVGTRNTRSMCVHTTMRCVVECFRGGVRLRACPNATTFDVRGQVGSFKDDSCVRILVGFLLPLLTAVRPFAAIQCDVCDCIVSTYCTCQRTPNAAVVRIAQNGARLFAITWKKSGHAVCRCVAAHCLLLRQRRPLHTQTIAFCRRLLRWSAADDDVDCDDDKLCQVR